MPQAFPKVFLVFVIFLPPFTSAQATQASITREIKALPSVPNAQRPAETRRILSDIRSLPAGMPKVWMATGLTRFVSEDKTSKKTMQALARTLEEAIVEVPQPSDPLERDLDYMNLASFIHYQHVHVNLNDPQLRKALGILAANDADVARANFTLQDLQGRTVTLSTLRGQIVLINFWATWCAPCRQEMPALDAIYTRFQSQGIVVLSLTSEQRSKVEAFMKRTDYHPRVLLDTGGRVSKQFHVSEIPHTFVFDRKGRFVVDSIEASTEQQFLAMLTRAGLHS
jgi:peroxiredoxin/uncharacterized protein YukE